jgi:hypothetical protein
MLFTSCRSTPLKRTDRMSTTPLGSLSTTQGLKFEREPVTTPSPKPLLFPQDHPPSGFASDRSHSPRHCCNQAVITTLRLLFARQAKGKRKLVLWRFINS